ncbi:hypothetical protein [Nocardiopsis aegyptia]|uniref:Uncharacterized protein n=1 Tax=Nocardiopsis aegyptia TaxID=220378 RepID=A0A7Z0ERL8_9ACTN|nr:hypothetical protein [Nocardiopsis aegyptia]NYJ36612.1 hypothetical protein [Nocardiopsis aegyptia]
MHDSVSSPAPAPAEVHTDKNDKPDQAEAADTRSGAAPTDEPTTDGPRAAEPTADDSRAVAAGRRVPLRIPAGLTSLPRVDARRLFTSRRAGQRPPADVTQTAGVLFAALPVGALQAFLVWSVLDTGVPDRFLAPMWTLVVGAAVVGAALAGTAIPVRRAVPAPLWTARVLAVVALCGSAAALRLAAQFADTALMLAGFLSAMLAITANIALWSTEVRRWYGVRDS